jgi:excisionase family DNA binding protein
MTRSLRVEQGLTVDQLASRLALPRSTIYYWVRDLPLRAPRPGEAPERTARGGGGASEVARRVPRAAQDAAYEEGLRSYEQLAAQPTFRDFVCLYITQGDQRDRTRVALTNSDPAVMRLVNRWLWRLTDKSPFLSIRYEPDQSLNELRRFWSETIGAEARTIRVDQRAPDAQPEGPSWRSRHGVLTVTVDDTLLRARLQAWMYRTRESWL